MCQVMNMHVYNCCFGFTYRKCVKKGGIKKSLNPVNPQTIFWMLLLTQR
jgi:hypothetical protein